MQAQTLEQTQSINGQQRKVSHFTIRWCLKPNQQFSVFVKGIKETPLKEWEFEGTGVNEAISYCWYDYVIRSIEQQLVLGIRKIPEFLMTTSSGQASELVRMVFEKI